jgi:hypothetical protein
MSSSDASSSSSVLVLHSFCHEKDAAATEMTFETAWRKLVATTKFSCDMVLIPDMAVAQQHNPNHNQGQQQQHQQLDIVKFRNELLDPCGTYNVFSLSNLVADSYILSLTDCRLRPTIMSPSSSSLSDILLPALAVPSTWHFTWNASEAFHVDAHAHAEIEVNFDLTKAKRQFLKVWQNKESTETTTTTTSTPTTNANTTITEEENKEENDVAKDQLEEHHSPSTEATQVPPAPVDNDSLSHVPVADVPSCPVREMPPLLVPPARTASIAHDPRFMRLETLMQSELNDINRILSILTVTGLVLFVSFLWTAFYVSHSQSQSHSHSRTRTPQKKRTGSTPKLSTKRDIHSSRTAPPMESISIQAVSGGGADSNLSPLSLDTILAAQGHGLASSSAKVKLEKVESSITYGPKQRSSRRTRQPRMEPTDDDEKDDNNNNNDDNNVAEPPLSPCSKLAQQWSRNKSARRSLRKDANTVESSLPCAAVAETETETETNFVYSPPKKVRESSAVTTTAAVKHDNTKSTDSFAFAFTATADDEDDMSTDSGFAFFGRAACATIPEVAGHAAPVPVTTPLRQSTTNATSNFSTTIQDHPLLSRPPAAVVSPGPMPRVRAAPPAAATNESSFVNEYWGARAM